MSEHTPGPWRITATTRTNDRSWSVTAANPDSMWPGAAIFIANGVSPDDARLIAAAPELLEAAKRMAELGFDHDEWSDEECAVMDALEAAIAKAKSSTQRSSESRNT